MRTINGSRGRRGGGERCSFERSRDIMDSRKSTQSNIYYFFPRKVWEWREREGGLPVPPTRTHLSFH